MRSVRALTLAVLVLVATATVASAQVPIRIRGTIARVSGQTLTMNMAVPTDVPIVTFAPGDRAMLQPGAHVFIPAQQHPDGVVTAGRVLVGKDGLVPPM